MATSIYMSILFLSLCCLTLFVSLCLFSFKLLSFSILTIALLGFLSFSDKFCGSLITSLDGMIACFILLDLFVFGNDDDVGGDEEGGEDEDCLELGLVTF